MISCVLWIFVLPLCLGLTTMEFDKIELNIEPGTWRLIHLPGVSSSTGLINITIQDTQDQDIVVYANPVTMPTNTSLYVDSNQMTIASGWTDNINWYFLAFSKHSMVPIKGVNFSVNVLETITLTSGQPSEPITLHKHERLLFKVLNPNHDFAIVQLMAFDPDLQISIYCNTMDPSVIPFLTENNKITKFPVFLHTLSLDHPEWYFVVESGNGIIEGYIMVTSISSIQLTYGEVTFLPYVQPGQQTICVLPRVENKGGIIQYTAQSVNGTKMPRVTARYENMNQPDKVVQSFDYLFANTDNVNWYFYVVFPNTSFDGIGISLIIISTDTTLVEGSLNWPLFSASILLKKTTSNYSLLRFTNPQTFFLFSAQVRTQYPVLMSVGAGTIQTILGSQTSITIESPVISTTIDYWIVISGITFLPPVVTIYAYGAENQFPGPLTTQVSQVTFYRLQSDQYGSAIINVVKYNQAVIKGYCSGWKNNSWVILSTGSYSSLDTEDVDWWFRVEPQKIPISVDITTVQTIKITENTWISQNDLQINQYRVYNIITPNIGIIEFRKDNKTSDGNSNFRNNPNSYLTKVGTDGRVPDLNGLTPPHLMYVVGTPVPGGFPFWIVVYGNAAPEVDAGFLVVTHEIQNLEINQPKRVNTKNGISILRLDPTDAESNAILQYSIVTPESPTRVFGSSGIPPTTYQTKNEIQDNDWKLSSNINMPMFYISNSYFLNSHFNFTVSSPGDIHLCHTVLLCNGHGRCPTQRLSPHCECIHGIGYGFAGSRCDQTDRPYVWSGLVLFFCLSLIISIPTIYVSVKTCISKSRKKLKISSNRYFPIMGNMESSVQFPPLENYLTESSNEENNRDLINFVGENYHVAENYSAEINYSTEENYSAGKNYPAEKNYSVEENYSVEKNNSVGENNSEQLVVDLEDISYHVVDRIKCAEKQILKNVSAKFVSGEITAIMGPSGSGKSTLLRILGGKMRPSSGKILINGTKSSMSKLRHSIGYVPQEDILPIHVSVKEALYFSAKLRRNWSDNKIYKKVYTVLQTLGLIEQAKQFVTEFGVSGGLSGGQRKRASVGMEMVVDAKLLLMDEPTSGLDSATAKDLIDTLSKIAKEKNIAIVVVIHQPRHEIYAQFNNVFLLANGCGTYFGPPPTLEQLKTYLTNSEKGILKKIKKISNPADLAIDYFHEIDWNQIETPFRIIPRFNQIELNVSLPSRLSQMETFTKRAIYQVVRTPFTFYYFCFLVMIASFLVSWAFKDAKYLGPVDFQLAMTCPPFVRAICMMPQADDFLNFYLMICLALGLTSTTTSLPTFKEEKLIYQRESSSGTSSLAYFLGKNFAEIPNLLVQPLAFMSLFYWVTDSVIPPEKMYMILLGIQFSCMGLGYMAATLVQASQSLILGVVFVFLSIIISGFKPSLKTWKTFGGFGEIIPDISYARWGLEGLYIAELDQYEDIYFIDSSIDYYGYQKDNFVKCVAVLFALGLLFRVFAFFAMRFVHKK